MIFKHSLRDFNTLVGSLPLYTGEGLGLGGF